MEYVFEFILELVLEGSIEVSKSNKIPKWIRYPLIAIISLFFIGIIGIILFEGVLLLKDNIFVGLFFILLGLLLLILSILKFRKIYLTKINKK